MSIKIAEHYQLSDSYISEITPLVGEEPSHDYQSVHERDDVLENEENIGIIEKFKSIKIFKYVQVFSFFEHIIYFCTLSLGSYAGVLIRIYLIEISQYNILVFPSFYAQLVGSAIMGFTASHKNLIENIHKSLYQGIATGLCGSITTFSTWNFEATEVLFMKDGTHIVQILGWITVLIVGLVLPVGALFLGKHLARLSPLHHHRSDMNEIIRPRKACLIVVLVFIVVFWACSTALIIFLAHYFEQNELLFCVVFCFIGTYIRWHLAPLNLLFNNFKLGTFFANISGVLILGLLSILISHFEGELSEIEFSIIKGVAVGFCGCLTTVSTFAMELSTLPLKASYSYGAASIIFAQIILMAIRGVYVWSI